MKMVRIKTAELIGAQLDWAVAKARGMDADMMTTLVGFAPSRQWSDGGPIIERERINLVTQTTGSWGAYVEVSRPAVSGQVYIGKTALVSAMRAFVASKLGDEVEVPEAQK